MNHYPNREQVQALRERYPPGTLIQLTADMQGERFQAGDIGKVTVVDDIGQIHMAWEKGGSLALIPGVDSFREIFTEPLELMLMSIEYDVKSDTEMEITVSAMFGLAKEKTTIPYSLEGDTLTFDGATYTRVK